MNKLDEAIASTAYILDCLRSLRTIHESGSCNDCGMEKMCKMKPKLGQMVRYNCPHYTREGEECHE